MKNILLVLIACMFAYCGASKKGITHVTLKEKEDSLLHITQALGKKERTCGGAFMEVEKTVRSAPDA